MTHILICYILDAYFFILIMNNLYIMLPNKYEAMKKL